MTIDSAAPQTTDLAAEETAGAEWAAYECAAMELWHHDPAFDGVRWSDLDNRTRDGYRGTALAVVRMYLDALDGN